MHNFLGKKFLSTPKDWIFFSLRANQRKLETEKWQSNGNEWQSKRVGEIGTGDNAATHFIRLSWIALRRVGNTSPSSSLNRAQRRPTSAGLLGITARNLLLEESPWRTNLGGIHGGERGVISRFLQLNYSFKRGFLFTPLRSSPKVP